MAWSEGMLYVDNSTDTFDSVGFVTEAANETSSTVATTSGFGLYGGAPLPNDMNQGLC
jgi:hypothetical protein